MPQDLVTPINTIIVEDNGLVIEEFEIGANATPAKMLPGTWVIMDTIEGDVAEGADESSGVIGCLMEKPDGALTDAYAVGDNCRVVTGGKGKILVRRITSGGALTPGIPMVCAGDGMTKIMAVGTMGEQGEVVCLGATVTADDTAAESNVIVTIHKGIVDKAAA